MKLTRIAVTNYKSVENCHFEINQMFDKSYTYGLIGENEAGKTSFLKAVALIDNLSTNAVTLKDYFDKDKPITIELNYDLENAEYQEIYDLLIAQGYDIDFKDYQFDKISILYQLDKTTTVFKNYLIIDVKKKMTKFLITQSGTLHHYIEKVRHKAVYWTYDSKYLISNDINLQTFFNNPETISIPLKNCFLLAKYDLADFPTLFSEISTDAAERQDLEKKLGKAVTQHIHKVWKEHKVDISFSISGVNISFLVNDHKSSKKAKTADQRSDGFKQFISFLLTISAQKVNSQLSNTILLLDEPETHLHPKAQQNLLEEICDITTSNNNIVFFATHSNYLIDKNILARNYKVEKNGDQTVISRFSDKTSTYASVNYDVFNIISTDYHNELYGVFQIGIEAENNDKIDQELKKLLPDIPEKSYKKGRKAAVNISLPTYIRHQIHHPENVQNERYTDKELKVSIELLLNAISILNTNTKI